MNAKSEMFLAGNWTQDTEFGSHHTGKDWQDTKLRYNPANIPACVPLNPEMDQGGTWTWSSKPARELQASRPPMGKPSSSLRKHLSLQISPTEFSGPLHPDHWRNAARRPDCQLSNRSRTWPWATSYKRQDPHLQALGTVPPKGKHASDPEFTPLTTFCMVHGVWWYQEKQ